MPRAVKDVRLDTPTARGRLAVQKKPHYRLIERGLHVGYYAGKTGGSWIARRQIGQGVYATHKLGLADDGRAADGKHVLTFAQAQTAARDWATQEAIRAANPDAAPPKAPLTVRAAATAYVADYTARGGKALATLNTTINAFILPTLGDRLVKDLTSSAITAWMRAIAAAPPRRRSRKNATAPKVGKLAPGDTEAHRARRASANRILTVLKSILNHAYREDEVASDDAWRRVAPFKSVDAARVRYLTDDEATRLVKACDADLARLVTAALLTGCRYGELAALTVGNLNLDAGMMTIPASKGGKARHVVLTAQAGEFLKGLCKDKARADLVLTRGGAAWNKSAQFRPLGEACKAAEISPAVSFHILRHTHATRLAMAGVPMGVVAEQLGHADLRMTTKHYAHLSPGYVGETIRAAFGQMNLGATVQPDPVA